MSDITHEQRRLQELVQRLDVAPAQHAGDFRGDSGERVPARWRAGAVSRRLPGGRVDGCGDPSVTQ